MTYQTVVPAYGRDYKSAKAALEDWHGGKDFRAEPQGQYCSRRDFGPTVMVNIRYAKLAKITSVQGDNDK